MKKFFIALALVILVALAVGFAFKERVVEVASSAITNDMFIAADTDSFDPGISVGAVFPAINALYDGREILDVGEFVGEKGMIFIANRSADWCPYCMAQFVQLQSVLQDFQEAQISVLALTYDTPLLQQAFVEKNGIEYPFLSDVDAQSVKALGILNEKYVPGDNAYGIPHPGIFIVNPSLEIVGKIFVDGYSRRVDSTAVYEQAVRLLWGPEPFQGAPN